MWYGRKRNVFPTSLFEYHEPPLLIRYLNVLCVACQELVRLTCRSRPRNSVLTVTCPVVDRSQLRSNGDQRICTEYRMQNAWEPDKPHTRAQITFIHRTSLSGGVRSKFWTCPKLANGQDRTKRISPDTERIHRMRNGQETHANGHERKENVTVRYVSVSAIR